MDIPPLIKLSEMPTDAIMGLLLFLIGTPALIYQLVSKDVIEIITDKRQSLLKKYNLPAAVGIFTVAAAALQYYLRKDQAWAYTWDFVLGMLLFLSLVTVMFILPLLQKEYLIKGLVNSTIKKYSGSGEYADEQLHKLELLGKDSSGGKDRGVCIAGMAYLTQHILDSTRYTGSQLEGLVKTLGAILLESQNASTPENFRDAIHILRKIVNRYYQSVRSGPRLSDADLGLAFRLLKLLAIKTVDLEEIGITIECLNIMETSADLPNPAASEAIRDIGIAAVNKKQMEIALQAAVMIFNMIPAQRALVNRPEILYDHIGLLAAIWSDGLSGKEWVCEYLDLYHRNPQMASGAVIHDAIDHYKRTTLFDTADKITQMNAEWLDKTHPVAA